MAKIGEIKFDIKGVDYKVHVNCTSSGQFNANLPQEVADALRIDKKITSQTLSALEEDFAIKLKQYKESETKETLYILVSYSARGEYTRKKDDGYLFGDGSKYNLKVNFNMPNNALSLDFIVAIKETVDGKDKWFKAMLGKDFSHIKRKESSQPDIYHRDDEINFYNLERYKKIPFNESALNTLQIAQEKLRMLSEMLFNFISQDEEQILLTLTNQKLLG